VVVVYPSTATKIFANTSKGHQQLIRQMRKLAPSRIGVEGTGGLQRALVAALEDHQLPIIVANPRQVRDLAKGTGQLTKTDPIDAAVLVHFAAVVYLPEPRPRTANERALQELLQRRRQLRDMHSAEECRRSRLTGRNLPSLERSLAFLTTELRMIEAEITALMHDDPLLSQKDTLLQSTPGELPMRLAAGHSPLSN